MMYLGSKVSEVWQRLARIDVDEWVERAVIASAILFVAYLIALFGSVLVVSMLRGFE